MVTVTDCDWWRLATTHHLSKLGVNNNTLWTLAVSASLLVVYSAFIDTIWFALQLGVALTVISRVSYMVMLSGAEADTGYDRADGTKVRDFHH